MQQEKNDCKFIAFSSGSRNLVQAGMDQYLLHFSSSSSESTFSFPTLYQNHTPKNKGCNIDKLHHNCKIMFL